MYEVQWAHEDKNRIEFYSCMQICSELQINTNAFLQTQLNIAFAGSELEAYLETRRDFQILVQEFILNILNFKSQGIFFSAENKEHLSSK